MALRVRVCRLADVVPGELRAFPVPGVTWPVIVTYVESELVAVQGVCPHEDVALADGDLVRVVDAPPKAPVAATAAAPASTVRR